jgi:hypothetical protein
VTEGWRILCNELHNLSSSLNIIRVIRSRRMRWVGHIAHMEQMRNVYKILIGQQLEGKRPFGRPRYR